MQRNPLLSKNKFFDRLNKNARRIAPCVFAVDEDKMKKNRIASCGFYFNKEILRNKGEKYCKNIK